MYVLWARVHLKSHILLLVLSSCTGCSFGILSCAASAEQPHLFACRMYILNLSGHSCTQHPRLLFFAGQSSQHPSLLDYAVDIQQALSCVFDKIAHCKAFLAHPEHAEGFRNAIRGLQGIPHAQMLAAASFLRLCLVDQDLQSQQKAYSRYAMLSGIMENISECIIAAFQVMPVNSATVLIAQQFADQDLS